MNMDGGAIVHKRGEFCVIRLCSRLKNKLVVDFYKNLNIFIEFFFFQTRLVFHYILDRFL